MKTIESKSINHRDLPKEEDFLAFHIKNESWEQVCFSPYPMIFLYSDAKDIDCSEFSHYHLMPENP